MDVQSIKDPLPGFFECKNIFLNYLDRITSYISHKRILKQHKRKLNDPTSALKFTNAKSILFLCFGNINRSALAEYYFKYINNKFDIIVTSAGFHKNEGRPADPIMSNIALEHGIDLSEHQSSALTNQLIKSSDVIFVMDAQQLTNIVSEFPNAREKTFLLGMLSTDHSDGGEISDPYGKPIPTYQKCYRQVTSNIDSLYKMIEHERSR
jgi:protein-tyrosine-phosphatase